MTQGLAKENTIIFAPETHQYNKDHLDFVSSDPVEQFEKWFIEAKEHEELPEAVTLATARLPSGRVSARTVLFKELDTDGTAVVYSNWGTSKKSKDINSNQHAAITFFWKGLQRQVRIEGTTEFISTEESQIYFNTRPRDSRIGAWSSPQSEIIENREQLEELVKEQEKRFEGVDEIPCPPFWGGLKIKPIEWEFWQGRPGRLHDRFSYTRASESSSKWVINRLAA